MLNIADGWYTTPGVTQPMQRQRAVQAPVSSEIFGPSISGPRITSFKDSDTAYVRLSKQGGYADLLHDYAREAPLRRVTNKSYESPKDGQMGNDGYHAGDISLKNSLV